jgi:hypothetical protein
MRKKISICLSIVITGALLVSCAKHEIPGYSGPVYSPTKAVKPVFQISQAGDGCLVFSHLLVTVPADTGGQDIARTITEEARARGADVVAIGQCRRGSDDLEPGIRYYGPEQAYPCKDDKWCGWKFGFDEWEKQGEWVGFGYNDWNNPSFSYPYPITLKAALLKCR